MRDPPASARLANAASVIWAKDEPEGQSTSIWRQSIFLRMAFKAHSRDFERMQIKNPSTGNLN